MEPKDSKLFLAVENYGKSLDEETIKRILRPFVLDENMMNHSKGLGLGLSLCQALLKAHKSELKIETLDSKTRVGFFVDLTH